MSKVLIVDDHENIRIFLERLLARPGIDFFEATHGEEALVIARREHPDVILIDVCMPGMDGLEVCAEIKADPALAGTRVILMSAVIGENGLRGSAEDIGADGYLGKPFNSDAVRRGVAAMLALDPFLDPCH